MSLVSVIRSNVREQLDWINFVKNSKLAKLQADINFAKRRVITLQSELADLRSAETLIIQKMNTQVRFADLNKYYSYDRYQQNDAINMLKPAKQGAWPDPDARISSTRNKLLKGLESYRVERDRVGSEILKVSQEIQKQKQILIDAQAELKKLGKDVTIFASKNDAAKRAYSEIYMLYEIHAKYLDMTLNADTVRKFNDSDRTIVLLSELHKKFQAFSERNPYVLNGDLKLDMDDPGSIINKAALIDFLERLRKVIGADDVKILDQKLESYCDQMESNMNDPWKSQDLTRTLDSDRVPPDEAQSKTYNKTTSKLVKNTNTKMGPGGIKVQMSWDYSSRGSSIQSNFKKRVSKLYKNMPYCVKTPLTPAEEEKVTSDLEKMTAATAGAEIQASQFAKTKTIISPETFNKAFDVLLNEVYTNIQSTSDKNTFGEYGLILPKVIINEGAVLLDGNNLYTAKSLYQTRILSSASRTNDYLVKTRLSGNLEETKYLDSLAGLVSVIGQANPKIDVKPYNI